MTTTPAQTLPSRPVDMQLRFSCPMCATILEIPRSRTGLEGPCPVCGATIVAPSVVVTPPVKQAVLTSSAPAPAPSAEAVPAEEVSPNPPSPHTARLCDLPPRPPFPAREAGTIPPDELGKRSKRSRRKKRYTVTAAKEPSVGQVIRKEFWLVLLALIALAVAAAFAIYGGTFFQGAEALPQTPQ